jgi:hypothetical protein
MSTSKQNSPLGPVPAAKAAVTDPLFVRRKWAKRPPAMVPDPKSLDQPQWVQGYLNVAGPPNASERAQGGTPAPAAAGGGPLFQSYAHCCDKEGVGEFLAETDRVHSPEDLGPVVGHEYRICPCRCQKWFCEGCGPRLGRKLRDRLLDRLRGFTGIHGITLTVDGSLFASPEESWSYVMNERCLSRLMRELHRRGHLHTKSYFWVVEFQSQTEQPHWHILLDASFIPFGELVEIWSRFRPDSASPLDSKITAENYQGQAPGFGSVRFTSSTDAYRAGYYATKYLTKFPRDGYPAWVLDRKGRMPRYGRSHRFFPRVPGHDPMCFCIECRGEEEPRPKQRPKRKPVAKSSEGEAAQVSPKPKPVAATIRERLEKCERESSIVKVQLVQLPDGTIVDGRGQYEGKLSLSIAEACEFLGLDAADRWKLDLDGPTVTELEEYAKSLADARKAA